MRVIRELVTRPSIFAVALIALASTVALGQEQAKPLVESSGVCGKDKNNSIMRCGYIRAFRSGYNQNGA